jgi:hypothetical protein
LQAAPAPHAHVPSDVHVSAVMPQLEHVPPFSPHCAGVAGSTHVLPAQHPTGQLVALQLAGHTPALHVPDVHATHAAPPVPHSDVVLPGSQMLPLQQPLPHEAALHTQLPEMHSWPLAQGDPLPHAQTPPAVHVSDVMPQLAQVLPPVPHCPGDVGSTHVEPLQQPLGHDAASQMHDPPEQT